MLPSSLRPLLLRAAVLDLHHIRLAHARAARRPSEVIMVRPGGFKLDPDTAETNKFQQRPSKLNAEEIQVTFLAFFLLRFPPTVFLSVPRAVRV